MQTFNITEAKKSLRAEIRARRKTLTEDYCQEADAAIVQHILGLDEYQSAKTVFCFVSTIDEVNTYPIIRHAWSVGKRVCVPKCIAKGIMETYEIKKLTDLEMGFYDIMEPTSDCLLVAPHEIDFCIAPCMSCTITGQRLGYGGGYYDRFLKDGLFSTAVVCREKLTCDEIPTLDQDVKINIVITEKGIWRIT